VTPDAVGILHQRPGGVMMAIGTLLGELDVFGMAEIEWLIQFALTVQGDRVGNVYSMTNPRQSRQQQEQSRTCEPETIYLHNEILLYMIGNRKRLLLSV
jgi:hypothetical protein